MRAIGRDALGVLLQTHEAELGREEARAGTGQDLHDRSVHRKSATRDEAERGLQNRK